MDDIMKEHGIDVIWLSNRSDRYSMQYLLHRDNYVRKHVWHINNTVLKGYGEYQKNPKDWKHHDYLDTVIHTEHSGIRRVQKNYYVTDTQEEEDVQVDQEEEKEEQSDDDDDDDDDAEL